MKVILSHCESYKSQNSIIFNATMNHEGFQRKKRKTALIDQRAAPLVKTQYGKPYVAAFLRAFP